MCNATASYVRSPRIWFAHSWWHHNDLGRQQLQQMPACPNANHARVCCAALQQQQQQDSSTSPCTRTCTKRNRLSTGQRWAASRAPACITNSFNFADELYLRVIVCAARGGGCPADTSPRLQNAWKHCHSVGAESLVIEVCGRLRRPLPQGSMQDLPGFLESIIHM